MASRFCSACGRPVPDGATFCPSCGNAVGGPVPAGAGGSLPPADSPTIPFLPPPGYGRQPPGVGPAGPSLATRDADRSALSRTFLAAILTIVGTVAGLAASVLVNLGGLVKTTPGPGSAATVTLTLPSPWVWVVEIAIGGALGLVALWLYRSAFATLAPLDRRFSTPAVLAVLAVIGAAVALIGVYFLLHALYGAVQCVGAGNPITRGCLLTGEFWLGLALVAVGGIVALVGFIGVLIGLWRIGTRYDETLVKVGAILLIIPYVSVVGGILIAIGASQARGRLP